MNNFTTYSMVFTSKACKISGLHNVIMLHCVGPKACLIPNVIKYIFKLNFEMKIYIYSLKSHLVLGFLLLCQVTFLPFTLGKEGAPLSVGEKKN